MNVTLEEENRQVEEDSEEFDVILEAISLPKDRDKVDSDRDSAFGSDREDFDFRF